MLYFHNDQQFKIWRTEATDFVQSKPGSILGSLLFLIYVNNNSSTIGMSNIILYADDSFVFSSGML